MLLFLLVFNPGCKNQGAQSGDADTSAKPDTLPKDFVEFFDKFHDDSVYQMAHILFPLEGLPSAQSDSDTLTTTRYFWQKEGWKKHNRFTDPSHQFDHWYEVINDRVIEHWIQMKGTNLVIRRRFAKLDDGWYLIYYAGMRPLKKKVNNE